MSCAFFKKIHVVLSWSLWRHYLWFSFKILRKHFSDRSENNNGRYSLYIQLHEYFRYSSDCCLWFGAPAYCKQTRNCGQHCPRPLGMNIKRAELTAVGEIGQIYTSVALPPLATKQETLCSPEPLSVSETTLYCMPPCCWDTIDWIIPDPFHGIIEPSFQ
jgi:hypothetical protein